MDRHERMRFSPSPEVDLFSPELSHAAPIVITPGSPFSAASSLHEEPIPQQRPRPSNRAPSPTLEADERGFTETASAVRANRILQQTSELQISIQEVVEETKHKTEHDVGMELFGRSHGGLSVADHHAKQMMSSPMMIPKHNLTVQIHDVDMDLDESSWNIKSPEHTSFDELDEMFDDF